MFEVVARVALGGVSFFITSIILYGMFVRRQLGLHIDPIKKRLVFDFGFLNPAAVIIALALVASFAVALSQLITDPPVFRTK